ncbi:MAG: FG-GAP-like repeat-containing protein [Chitinophagales bacterium]
MILFNCAFRDRIWYSWFIVLLTFQTNAISQSNAKSAEAIKFQKHILTKDFISEGVAIGDVNNDGKTDILAGAFWFEAPGWVKHELASPKSYNPDTTFSNSFLNFTMDVNQDGWIDLVRISLPGEEAVWYENTKNKPGHWTMHPIFKNCGNESPAFVDVNGDGRPDLICNDPVGKQMIWMQSPSKKGDTLWIRHVIAEGNAPGLGRYTHGLGFADMNGDGRKDVIITKGWWESPADPSVPNWVFHPARLGEECSQIYQIDVNEDGKPDLVSASAHNYGIWWHEKNSNNPNDSIWTEHLIYKGFSQSHGMAMADINGDGHPDLITGKRHFAHNGHDPGAFEPSVLYWFEFLPGKDPKWIPHLIDDHSGVGLQVVVADMNRDGKMDIVVSNKNGTYYFEQE